MADEEQLDILIKGVEVWNKWRKKTPKKVIDLSHIHLLVGPDLQGANLSGADLSGTVIDSAKLSEANFRGANLLTTGLTVADLRGADLHGAKLALADLRGANLHGANLGAANLRGARLSEADLSETFLGGTIFAETNLSNTKGLEAVRHNRASTIGTDTLLLSNGKIPQIFLRGCGLSDWEIESAKLYDPELSNEEINKALYRMYDLRARQPLQISPLFISYSHTDRAFVDRIEKSLKERGVRFWRDIHDATAGRLEPQIDRAITQIQTVLLILSKTSVESDWVQHEVRKARDLGKVLKQDVLCPIALDDSWKSSSWPERIMEQVKEYNILDFSIWQDENKFENVFNKLIDGLNIYYKK